jgi:hypothetical protein
VIITAYYSDLDVSKIIMDRYLKEGQLVFGVSNDIFGDPSPGAPKSLKIEIISKGVTHYYELPEGLNFKFPQDDSQIQNKISLMAMNRNQLIRNLNLTGIGIEIGVQTGEFSKIILDNSNLHLILLDSWRYFDSGYNEGGNTSNRSHINNMVQTHNNLFTNYEGRYTIIRELSQVAHQFFKDEMFDFIYLDSNHSHTHVMDELQNWWPKLKLGAVISGHDYVDRGESFGVKSAVDLFFSRLGLEVEVCDSGCCPTWWIKKK